MKNIMLKIIATLCVFSLGACFTPTQGIALATAEAGNAFASYVLTKNGAPAIKALTDLAAALPLIPQGKVSATQLGVINAELQVVQAQLGNTPANNQLYSQVGSLLSLVSQAAGAAGGNATIETGAIIASCLDVQNGINNAIQFWQGQQSVTKTSWWKAERIMRLVPIDA